MATLILAVAVGFTATCGAQQEAPRVALLFSDHGSFRHRDDYDGRLADLGWPLTKFENTPFAELVGRLSEFDVLLGGALFNYSNPQDLSAHAEPLLRFVREGGAAVLTDCNYPSMVTWLGGVRRQHGVGGEPPGLDGRRPSAAHHPQPPRPPRRVVGPDAARPPSPGAQHSMRRARASTPPASWARETPT
ncbi:MAG: hypothetical protein FJX74_13200 [Armatimonadetes bacterium]|nr:hypothetical protein [Armatimonadota bacterium]